MTSAEVRRFSLFAQLSEADAAVLGTRVTNHCIERGFPLFHQGDPARHLVLLPQGQVKMERVAPDGSVAIVEVLGSGSALAAANFLTQQPYPVTAIAATDLTFGTLSYADFEALVRHQPGVALALICYLAERLHRAYAARRAVARSHVRLADALARIAADASSDEDGRPTVYLSHSDLAEVAGMARETATRHLRVWQSQGIVELGVRSIHVRDLDALWHLANDC